jgi:hypothetical protein
LTGCSDSDLATASATVVSAVTIEKSHNGHAGSGARSRPCPYSTREACRRPPRSWSPLSAARGTHMSGEPVQRKVYGAPVARSAHDGTRRARVSEPAKDLIARRSSRIQRAAASPAISSVSGCAACQPNQKALCEGMRGHLTPLPTSAVSDIVKTRPVPSITFRSRSHVRMRVPSVNA